MRPVDDLVDRRRASEHRRRLRQNLVAGRQVREVQVPEHFDRAGLGGGQRGLQRGDLRSLEA